MRNETFVEFNDVDNDSYLSTHNNFILKRTDHLNGLGEPSHKSDQFFITDGDASCGLLTGGTGKPPSVPAPASPGCAGGTDMDVGVRKIPVP